MKWVFSLILSLLCLQGLEASNSQSYLGSQKGDPASLVQNVSVIHGDYTEVEVDLTVASPDSLVLSRFYSSRDSLQTAPFGGWRFNPHCFLFMEKDPKENAYMSMEGTLERRYVHVGNPDGSILTYVGCKNTTNPSVRSLFKIDPEKESFGLCNTAKGNISSWTNLKNNELYFDSQTDTFELLLCSEGKRFYSKHPSLGSYFLTQEILPSGNKIFYEFDRKGQLTLIQETNASEKKVLAWIKIEYGNGIRVETSDGKSVEYRFQQDSSGALLLSEVIRSDKPHLSYQYQVVENQALLTKKTLPEGRFVQIDYYMDKEQKHKVRAITTPAESDEKATVIFSYGDNHTEVDGPGESKAVYRWDEGHRLVAVEQYLDGSLYRIHQKTWGKESLAGNLISTSIADATGAIFYSKHFTYDKENKGNIVEEREYGDVIGLGSVSLDVNENGHVTNQEGHTKTYSYFSGKNIQGFFQADAMGTGVQYAYKKGTQLLLSKFIFTKELADTEDQDYKPDIKERHFYIYNEDAALTEVLIDDGSGETPKDVYGMTQRTITRIFPKQELPHVGAPVVVEQKYSSADGKSEFLLKRMVCQFDAQGNIASQVIYDADGTDCYTLTKRYERGLLVFETDPMGNETRYSYDGNQNLVLETHSNTGLSIEYSYDLRNNLISTREKDRAGNRFETRTTYDLSGYKLSEIDRYGNETVYVHDSLGRLTQITYPETADGAYSSLKPTYTYKYDLFDHPVSITDPKGRTLARSYNVHGKPLEIHHLNGTKEVFKYDSGGNLHNYTAADGISQAFSYDYKGRLKRLEYFKRGSDSSSYPFKEITTEYDVFHKIAEIDARGKETSYAYAPSGRLATLNKGKQKVDFIYDSLGRTRGIRKWKSAKTFTLETKEYDLLDRVIEERIEDQTGKVLFKKQYVYNEAGQLDHVIGYPQNKKSVLIKYEYDGFGRLCKMVNALGDATIINYDDAYLNEWGQRSGKRTLIDPLGNQVEELFDLDDRLVKSTQKDKTGQVLSDFASFFDCLGNPIAQKSLILSAHAPADFYEINRSLNAADQVESLCIGKGTLEERIQRYEYDSYGVMIAKYTHGFKDPITYRYNDEGNLDALFYQQGKNEIEHYLSYDEHNNITELDLDSSFAVSYSYDAHDMPLTEKIEDAFGSYQVRCSYDGEGKIQKLSLPDGSFVQYLYEGPFVKGAKRFSKEKKELYLYDVSSRDLMGNILEELLPSDVKRSQTWDETGRRVEIATDFFQDRILKGGYDPLGNIIQRETILDHESYMTEYAYNALFQLILEKGEFKHTYAYDSIGNRLQKDNSIYRVDRINQLRQAEDAVYTFDPQGNLSTKSMGTQKWTYRSNRINQIVSIKDSDQNVIHFTYDLRGKRLNKRIQSKGKKTKISRFFYLGETEIGSLDEKGNIVDLKIPSDPNDPEAPSIAIEIGREIYVPLYDLKGNISCLLDLQGRKLVETYRYSAYGEEKIFNERGDVLSDSSIGNPWRYRGKRVDKEVGLIYFGYRYYDAQVGRWLSPDPLGDIDGPNLYAYVHNNPLKYVDYFGLNSALDEDCGCTKHGHPGWRNAPKGCICICDRNSRGQNSKGYRRKIGSDIKRAICGVSHGVVDFMLGSIHDLQTQALYIGTAELEMSYQERVQIIEAVEQSQVDRMTAVESWMMDLFSIDESDALYHSFRSATTLGLDVASIATGAYGTVKGVMAFTKLAKAPQQVVKIAKISAKTIKIRNGFFGYKEFELKNPSFQPVKNKPASIRGRAYSSHAIDQMQNRGFTPSVIEETIQRGSYSLGKNPGTTVYYDAANDVTVVLNREGRVVTVSYGDIKQ